MIRIAIDSNIIDKIMDTPELLNLIQVAASKGHLIMVTTHLLPDQLSETPDVHRRAQLLATYEALPKQAVPARGGIWGKFQWGQIIWGEPNKEFNTPGRGKFTDAILATTASGDADVLVTEDNNLRKKVKTSPTSKCSAWDFSEFEKFVRKSLDDLDH